MNRSIIFAKNLSKWYGEVIGLNSLNLKLSGGITGIVGPNGAGKSTLFKLATGMVKPNKGSITVMGEDPWRNHELMRRVGLCPDYDNLSDYSTGRRYLYHIGSLHGLKNEELERRIEKSSKDVGAQKFLNRKISSHSQGMRQRLKLAGALLHDPDLLLLDEPLSGADPQARKDLIELIQNFHEEKEHDVLVSSHVLNEIEKMTSDIALLYKGRVIASGDISEVRGLIDKHPHNIVIDGTNKKELAKLLLELDYVVSVGFEDNRRRLVVEVEKPDEFFQQIASLVNQTETEVFEMYSRDDNLQAVFDYLVGGRSK